MAVLSLLHRSLKRPLSLRNRLILGGLLIGTVLSANGVFLILAHHSTAGISILAVTLAALVIAAWTDFRLRSNVARLIEATSQVLEGAGRAEVDTGDQLQSLGERFNSMAEAIRLRQAHNEKMQAQLNEQALYLESQVAARTRELDEERGKLNAIVTAIPAGLVLVDENRKVLWVNPVVETWCAFPSEIRGKQCHELIWRTREACEACPTARALASGKVEAGQRSIAGANGEKKYFQIISSPIWDSEGRITGAVELLQDVTESRLLHEQLVQTGKMAAVGQLAAGVAHEINNPIGIILGKTELILSHYRTLLPEKVVSDLQTISRHTRRVAGITHGLLQFSRRGVEDWGQVNLNELVRELVTLVDHQFSSGKHRLKLSLQANLPSIRGNRAQLQEALLNLLSNALDAMADAGEVEIRTSCSPPAENGVGEAVILAVRDTGIGISDAIRDRIFDPFFTTKPPGKGTGLGLSILHGIAKNHGAEVRVESIPGQGTIFELAFPRTAQGASGEGRTP